MANFIEKMSGTKPKVPAWTPIDITAEQQKTVAGNQATLPGAMQLGSDVNTFNQSELDRLYGQALPGYDRIKGNISDYLSAMTSGQLPDDVADEIYRRTTSGATARGFGGSGLGRNLTARDFGLTSLDFIGRGIDSTQRWLSTQTAPRFDVTSMFLSPAQRIPMAMEERNLKFQHDYLKAQIDAMPDAKTAFWTTGVTNFLMGMGNVWGANYQTTAPSEWSGGGAGRTPQMNTGSYGGGGGGGGNYISQPDIDYSDSSNGGDGFTMDGSMRQDSSGFFNSNGFIQSAF